MIHTYEIPSGVEVNETAGASSEVDVNSKTNINSEVKVSSDCRWRTFRECQPPHRAGSAHLNRDSFFPGRATSRTDLQTTISWPREDSVSTRRT